MMLSRSHYRPDPAELEQKLADISRGGHLTQTQVSLIAASVAGASGHADTTRLVLRLARVWEIPHPALYEAILQTYLFAGYPRAINALSELRAAFPEAPLPSIQLNEDLASMERAGTRLCRQVYGGEYPKLLTLMERISEDLGRWMIAEGYGKVLSRPGLDGMSRELCAVGALLALHVPPQLKAHMRGCINLGASWDQVHDAVEVGAQLVPEQRSMALELLQTIRGTSS